MAITAPAFSIGIEEEYLLVDLHTRALAADPPEALFDRCRQAFGDRVGHEFLRAQLEIATGVCADAAEAEAELRNLRRGVAEIAADFGLGIIAASTHPFAYWSDQQHTAKERYDLLAEDLQTVVRRLVTCGMHVHVGIGDPDLRIELMNRSLCFLPYLLALSTSSPFWGGEDTGLCSYRLSVFNELPRTGLPDRFSGDADYRDHVKVLTEAGLIGDASMLWWDLRPSCRFPTLEMRITDVCTRVNDAATIAALFQATLATLWQQGKKKQHGPDFAPMLVRENRWRAQRYGIHQGMIDFRSQTLRPFAELLDEWLELISNAATALNAAPVAMRARDILHRGTSADAQRRVFRAALSQGQTARQALEAVVDHLLAETLL